MMYRNMGLALGILVLRLLTTGSIAYSAAIQLDNPQLSVSRTQGALLLRWPDWATNWAIEESAQLQPDASWTALASGTNNLRRNILPATNGFFRLRNLSPTVSGLSGFWRFDEGTGATAADEVPNAPLVFFTNASWGIGRVGPKALRFNGASSSTASRAWAFNTNYALLPSAGQPFSLSLSFSPEALPIGQQLLAGTSNGWTATVETTGPGTNKIVFASGTLNLSGRTILLPGQWYDLTITFDGTQVTLYLDANLIARQSGSVTAGDQQIFFGGGIAGYSSFLGRIDEVRTYKTALSDEAISLTGYWPFDEQVGTTAYDKSVYGHNARLSAQGWAPGKIGAALQVSSNEATIDNPHLTVLPPSGGPFSVSLWLYPYSLPLGRSGLLSAGNGTNSNWELTLEADNAGQAALALTSAAGNGTLDMRAPVEFSNRAWTKLDLTYDGGIASLYINGRKVRQDSGLIQSGRVPLRIGCVPGVRNFDGLVDELKIYRRQRAASEIGPTATVMWETVLRGSSTNFTLQGSGPPGKVLTYSILNSVTPSNGAVSQVGGTPAITYQAGTRKGPDALVFTVNDGEFTSVPATLHLSIVEPHWISSAGGSIQPFDGSTPEQAWSAASADAVDAIWRTNSYYDCFFYAPGVYETHGWHYGTRPTARPGCKHVGSGSEGPQATTIRLVGVWDAWNEDYIFAPAFWEFVDDFEVHNLLLDCNAENNPKYTQGESQWIKLPLTSTTLVHSITLRWNRQSISGIGPDPYQFGAAREFRICTRTPALDGYLTNCTAQITTGSVDVVSVEQLTDQIIIQLDRRNPGIDFYSIAEIEVTGGAIALPSATRSGGAESRLALSPFYSIRQAVDGNPGTVWASGSETNVQITLPADPASSIDGLRLQWNCQSISGGLRLGPASQYIIRARRLDNGQFVTVPFTRQARTPNGMEDTTFASPVQTDQFVLELTAREPDADVYSLGEVTALRANAPVAFRVPSALSAWPFSADASILQACDGAPETAYNSFSQGMIGAISVAGNNLKFTGLKVIGFGTKAGRECFVFYLVNSDPAHQIGNILVENCLFTAPATHNRDGISCLSLFGKNGSLTNAAIRGCTVRDLSPFFGYDHAFAASTVEGCLVENCGQPIYFEPDFQVDYVGDILIRSNRFNNVHSGLFILFHPGRQFGGITFTDNHIVLKTLGGWGVAASDVAAPGRSASITNLTMLRNVIRYADWLPRPASLESGIVCSDIQNALFVNNLLALGTPSSLRIRQCPIGSARPPSSRQQCSPNPPIDIPGESAPACLDHLPPGYRRVWMNNCDLSGNLLQVRFNNNGVDGPASQQQPPSELP